MIAVELRNSKGEPPDWWLNFIEAWLDAKDAEISAELAAWQCCYREPEYCDVTGVRLKQAVLEFDSEKAFTLFLLRWA